MEKVPKKEESKIDILKELIYPNPAIKFEITEIIVKDPSENKKNSFSSKLSYILLLVGFAVGFGNIWRFPYLMQENGGVVFLIPYSLSLAFLGLPIFFLELGIGQRLGKGSLRAWLQISPYLGGVGVSCGAACFLVAFYYNTLIAWCWYYLLSIFNSELAWSSCNITEPSCLTDHNSTACRQCEQGGPTSYFWYNNVLHISKSIQDPGDFSWGICGCLFLSWFCTWVVLVRGIKMTSRIAYVTALFPYTMLIIFFIRGLTLNGMELGFLIVFKPDWSKLLMAEVWFEAGTQIFFSLGLGMGMLGSLSSLQKPRNNCYHDAILVSLVNCGTSIFAAIVIFPTLGYKGHVMFQDCKERASEGDFGTFMKFNISETFVFGKNKTGWFELCDLIEFVTESAEGPGLIFIAFTEAIKSLPFPQGWAFLFFLLLLFLGVDSSFCIVEGAIFCISDWNLFQKNIPKWIITTCVCSFLMLGSIIFSWGWGEYMLAFFDEFSTNWTLLIIAFVECISVVWIYGLKQFSYDIHLMTGEKPTIFMLLCWKYISPLLLFLLFASSIYQYTTSPNALTYEIWEPNQAEKVKTRFPNYLVILGLLIVFFVTGPILIFAILALFKIYPIKANNPTEFPEEELRAEREIDYSPHDARGESKLERIIFWGTRKARKRVMPSRVEKADSPGIEHNRSKSNDVNGENNNLPRK